MNMVKGVAYIAFGKQAQEEAQRSITVLKKHNLNLPIKILTSSTSLAACSFSEAAGFSSEVRQLFLERMEQWSNAQLSRWAKVSLDLWSPFQYTLYLDADTRPGGDVGAGFTMLMDGWDIVQAASTNQGRDWLWHVSEEEKKRTERLWDCQPLQLQAGVVFFRKNKATKRLFKGWRTAWSQYNDQDQGALLRALYRNPVRIWMLGSPWNGNGFVRHLFGNCRGGE